MFATRKYRDEFGQFDAGFGSVATSVSSSYSGKWQDLSKFHRYIYKLFAYGNAQQPTLMLFSASNVDATSLGSSASSNWAAIDSVSCAVTMSSASASVSTNQYCAMLEVRAEKMFSGVSPIRYIRPVLVTNSTANNGSSSVNGFITCEGFLPAYGTGSSLETAGFVVNESDYL